MKAILHDKKVYLISILLVIVGYFLYLMVPCLNRDLWNDETYTLRHFTIGPLWQTLTDYRVPNNHIFFNIVDHFYLRLIGVRQMSILVEHPWILRVPMLFIALATLVLIYQTAKLSAGRLAGILAVAILVTCIPFQNFCLQIRGYGFTMFFGLLLLYSSLRYLNHKRKLDLVLMVVCSFILVYTIPSNIYCIIGILGFWGFEWLYDGIRERTFTRTYWVPVLMVMIGVGVAILCYLPIYKEVVSNRFVTPLSPPFQLRNIIDATFFYRDMVEGRKLLFVLFGLSAFLYFIPVMPGFRNISRTWRLVCWQFVGSIAAVVATGQHPPCRVFIYLSVFLALLMAVTLAYAIRLLLPGLYRPVAITILVVYLICACERDRAAISDIMDQNIANGVLTQTLRTDFYLHDYDPLTITHYLIEQNKHTPPPVILRPEDIDMEHYLRVFQVPFHSRDSIDQFLSQGHTLYLMTYNPHNVDSGFVERYHCTVREVLPHSFHHVYELERR